MAIESLDDIKKKDTSGAKPWKKSEEKDIKNRRSHVGANLGFGAKEAYKLLRSNITLSIEDDGDCKVICFTSAMPGEGKSTTCINLAYTLAEADYSVLLIEADMRLPHLAEVLKIPSAPGLSNLLTALKTPADAIYASELIKNLYAIPAGEVPPNPSELLSSKRMEQLLVAIKDHFDYILIDLPPVNVVSDSLNIIRISDGIVLVVRQDYSDKREVSAALSKLDFLGAKVLGFVLNDASGKSGSYGKAYSYGRTYANAGAYAKAAEKVSEKSVSDLF